jgi:hypothetical protein
VLQPGIRLALLVEMAWALPITEMLSLVAALTLLEDSVAQSTRQLVATMGKEHGSLGLVGRCRAISMLLKTRPYTQITTIPMHYQATKASFNISLKPRRCYP